MSIYLCRCEEGKKQGEMLERSSGLVHEIPASKLGYIWLDWLAGIPVAAVWKG
jgi:hypothetical protein